jgi:hypothetical protein
VKRKTSGIEALRKKLARIVLDDYDRNVRPKLKRSYTLPGEPQLPGVLVRTSGKPTKPRH